MARAGWLVLLTAGLALAGYLLWRGGAGKRPERPPSAARQEDAGSATPPGGLQSPGAPLVPWGQGLPREGQWRHGFELVDFNGDGHLDVVHGPARKAGPRTPRVFLGDGAGRFREDTSLRFPPAPLDYGDVAVLDVDADGALDLAVASHLQGLTVLLRRGGGFEAAPLPPAVASFSSRALATADVDGDGRVDLVASSDGPRPFARRKGAADEKGGVLVLLGGASGLTPLVPKSDVTVFGDSLAIGDVDGAPGVEIVSASGVIGSDHLLYRRGTDGAFVLERLPGVPPGSLTRVVALVPDPPSGARVLLGGLVTGAAGLEGSLVVVRPADGSATGLFQGAPLRAVSAVGTGDLDGDGLVDVVFGEEDGSLHVLAGTRAASSGFASRGSVAPAAFAGCAAYGIALADLDGERGDEVVVSFAGEGAGCASGGGIEVYRARLAE